MLGKREKKTISEKKYISIIKKSKYFDSNWYKKNYLNNENINNLAEHYFNEGWLKGYNPSPFFSTLGYLKDNEKVKICPLLDYELFKKENNRKIRAASIIYDGDYKEKKIIRYFKRKFGEVLNMFKILKNRKSKILVCLHLFYYYSFYEIKEYLLNLEYYNYDLIVTIPECNFKKSLIDDIKKFKSDVKIVKCENKGFDVGPFFQILKDINLKKYDVIFKLQSKGTKQKTIFIYNQIFKDREWFINLYEGVLGAINVHKNIDKIANKKNINMIAAKNLIIEDPLHKKNLLKENIKDLHLKYFKNYKFIAGTCFVVKSSSLKEVQNLNLSIDNFGNTRRGIFSLAHVMERYICFEAQKHGQLYGNNVCLFTRLKWRRLEKKLKNISALNILNNKKYVLNDDFVYYSLEGNFIKNYKIEKMRLSEIRREWYGEYFKLEECAPYKYLKGDKKSYREYCKYHIENNLPLMTEERFNKLIKSINEKGYISKYPLVIKADDNSIMDGQHRACILLNKYGKDYEIEVLKISFIYLDFSRLRAFSSNVYEIKK